MATDEQSGEEKKHPASQTKLKNLRKKGTVAHSRDFIAGATTVVIVLALVAAWDFVSKTFAALLTATLDDTAAGDVDLLHALAQTGGAFTSVVVPFLGLTVGASFLAYLLDAGGITFSGESVAPNFTRLNPMKGLKRLFELKALSELLKSLIKLAIVGVGSFLAGMLLFNTTLWAPLCGDACAIRAALSLFGAIALIGCATLILSGFVDLGISRALFRHDQRMTQTEFKREQKEEFGSPELRKGRKSFAHDLGDMPPQDLLAGAEPTFWLDSGSRLVGLYYDAGTTSAPVVLALLEGTARAQRIRAGFRVPIMTQSPLADEVFEAAVPGRYIQLRFFERVAQAMAS
ncbi:MULTISPECIES: EscU/YscU/HrcU family type III secretion system export apparatus switch protein [unclassified Aureimonas]|uniref:EscU/YscU/HrcU family type III secretion system export apparatus switch protein n=1 Tax=unclassified Aureimonas TaxID=2615206 RepID=UPI0006F9BD9C|nr:MULTISPECIES: EscU/YscU/HrcU family type III secretion system export apparatus switch protein [unclassified Aureimonas]KQT60030.1 hypothetical protein ASG62_24225 [Aureimonas sp. Leaf427]KQT79590.1 hypothetical protein ASG54_08480 [Aureimonas sp. Leaf460]